MENISENRRGRPRKHDPYFVNTVYMDQKPGVTYRTKVNFSLAIRALRSLKEYSVDLYNHFLEKRTILTELGRIDDDKAIVSLAERIRDDKIPTKTALALIRRARGVNNPGDTVELANQIIRLLNEYRLAHDLTEDDIDESLALVREQVSREEE